VKAGVSFCRIRRSVSSRAAQIDGAVEAAARRPVRNRGRVRLGRRRLLSGKAWQAGASREVNVPVEEKVPLVVLLVRVALLSAAG
jgi:hypothetical protein